MEPLMKIPLAALSTLAFFLSTTAVNAQLRAGAAVTDITPTKLPVIVNGSMRSRTVSKINTRINARSLAISSGDTKVVIVVADSCMMPRPLLDAAKTLASKRTGVPAEHILISATHAHSAPSSMGALGTDADETYVPFLIERLAEAIAAAVGNLQPAKVGFAQENAAEFTALRRWIRRPDRVGVDPFGNKTVRATMHAGRNLDDVTGESGPEDPDLQLISFQSLDGKPIAVLANFSMHYFSDRDISADYFGWFCNGLKNEIAPGTGFVGIMSHGCSGDIWRRDYANPDSWNPDQTIQQYAKGLVDVALKAYRRIRYETDVPVEMLEHRMALKYRVPDAQRLTWAKSVVETLGDRLPETQPEIYAREQLFLHEKQQTEIVTQALQIGDTAITTTPCETYAVTALKMKAASPFRNTMVIELANGGDGYIPPPEQHLFGGYNTWAARSAGLEVQTEPKIVEANLGMLERLAGKPRRSTIQSKGATAEAIAALKPAAWWRLDEFTGPTAVDSSGHDHSATYEPHTTFYLEGPKSLQLCSDGETNRAAMFVGGRLRARLGSIRDDYTVSLWVWNGMPNKARAVSGWLWSRDRNHGVTPFGDHVGIAGTGAKPGRVMFAHANTKLYGKTEIPRWTWTHIAFVRSDKTVSLFVNGKLEAEGTAPSGFPSDFSSFFFGGRSNNDSNWEGRLDEIAVFDKPLSIAEVATLSANATSLRQP